MKNIHNIQKRQKQIVSLIEAAEQIIEKGGLENLKMRALAARVGIALGQIYNLIGDFDEIILAVNSRTIVRLEEALEQFLKSGNRFSDKNCVKNKELEHLVEPSETKNALEDKTNINLSKSQADIGEEKLISMAIAYYHFARDNYHLWHALFDHRPAETQKKLPVWVSIERLRPFRLIEQLLDTLCPTMTIEDRRIFAQTLFSAVHGIVLMALDARDVGVRIEHLDEQIRLHFTLVCSALKTQKFAS